MWSPKGIGEHETMSELSEDPAERARKYIANFEKTLQQFTLVKADTAAETARILQWSQTRFNGTYRMHATISKTINLQQPLYQ